MSVFPDPSSPIERADLVTVFEFAQQYRVDVSVVRSWIKMGYIDYVLVGPRQMRRIRKSDVVKPLEAQDEQQTRAARPAVGARPHAGRK